MEIASFGYTIIWYSYLLVLGILFYPTVKLIFGKVFFDKGYAFSKIIAILTLSYSAFILGQIFTFTRLMLFGLILFFALIQFLIINKYYKNKNVFDHKSLKAIFWIEALFLISFMFWVIVRGQEPSIHGLEKFMDFGFINSILRSRHFPPLDMWLSADQAHPKGYPINYYYFGHLTWALLIKLTNIPSYIGYNLILATLFGLGITEIFSIVSTLIKNNFKKASTFLIIILGLLGSFLTNLGGNLHTIYIFTKGYAPEHPIPFWKIMSFRPHPEKYWYPNATRFIYHTIHEFPSYSYVVADLHGHVFDIPFVILTLSLTYLFIFKQKIKPYVLGIIFGFLIAVHYMTNASDGPIYILYFMFALALARGLNKKVLLGFVTAILSFLLFSYPFSSHFIPFSHQIGLNCPPKFLSDLKNIGPFVFIYQNCQISPLWMLFILWGFFWFGSFVFLIKKIRIKKIDKTSLFVFSLFFFGTFLIIIPEFFYAKDIYPTYFRANTMFKLGYQAFIMMSIATAYTIALLKLKHSESIKTGFLNKNWMIPVKIFFAFLTFLVSIYPIFSIPPYYGSLRKKVNLDGSKWINSQYHGNKEAIDYINRNIKGQPVIIEAQGDSYTDYNMISAYTGLPTVAGWWVHEWLWRGSSGVVGKRAPDVQTFYTTNSINKTLQIAEKYNIQYIIVSPLERKKYKRINEQKFPQIADKIFSSSDGTVTIYKLKLSSDN